MRQKRQWSRCWCSMSRVGGLAWVREASTPPRAHGHLQPADQNHGNLKPTRRFSWIHQNISWPHVYFQVRCIFQQFATPGLRDIDPLCGSAYSFRLRAALSNEYRSVSMSIQKVASMRSKDPRMESRVAHCLRTLMHVAQEHGKDASCRDRVMNETSTRLFMEILPE